MSSESSQSTREDAVWAIIKNIPSPYDNLFVKDEALWIKSENHCDGFAVSEILKIASESLLLLDTNGDDKEKYVTFLQWICALSMSFNNSPVDLLKSTLMTNKCIIHNVLDLLFRNVIQKGLLFINKEHRTKLSSQDNRVWLSDLLQSVPFDERRSLTPEMVKTFVNELITIINVIISETASKTNDKFSVIGDYFKESSSSSIALLHILFHLLGTFVSPKSIHMKSMELSFHSKLPIKSSENKEKPKKIYKSHNDQTQYLSAQKWRVSKAAQITVQFHRLLIKLIWIIINDIHKTEERKDLIFQMILKHPLQRVVLLQLMHFSVMSYQCATDFLRFICQRIYNQSTADRDVSIVYSIGTAFVTLCDEYQLEGNEFKVNMFAATLTTDHEEGHSQHKNDENNSNSKELSVDPAGSHIQNIVRFANSVNSVYTFNVKQTILIILPLISQCIQVRDDVIERKEVIEFLKELFFVTLPQCSYLFIRFHNMHCRI